jgi:hypothetical protein
MAVFIFATYPSRGARADRLHLGLLDCGLEPPGRRLRPGQIAAVTAPENEIAGSLVLALLRQLVEHELRHRNRAGLASLGRTYCVADTKLHGDVEGSTRRSQGRTGSLPGPPSISKEAIWGDDR